MRECAWWGLLLFAVCCLTAVDAHTTTLLTRVRTRVPATAHPFSALVCQASDPTSLTSPASPHPHHPLRHTLPLSLPLSLSSVHSLRTRT